MISHHHNYHHHHHIYIIWSWFESSLSFHRGPSEAPLKMYWERYIYMYTTAYLELYKYCPNFTRIKCFDSETQFSTKPCFLQMWIRLWYQNIVVFTCLTQISYFLVLQLTLQYDTEITKMNVHWGKLLVHCPSPQCPARLQWLRCQRDQNGQPCPFPGMPRRGLESIRGICFEWWLNLFRLVEIILTSLDIWSWFGSTLSLKWGWFEVRVRII